jgi:hypothetical protein
MAETVGTLPDYLDTHVPKAKVVVWEHSSHLSDARATEMSQRSEVNVGQRTRERCGRDAVLGGFHYSRWHGYGWLRRAAMRCCSTRRISLGLGSTCGITGI